MLYNNLQTSKTNNSLIDYVIPPELYVTTKGWFVSKGFDPSTAETLAASLIAVVIDAEGSPADISDMLKTYESSSSAEMLQLTAFLMNSSRIQTSYVGYESPRSANMFYQRLVI